MSLAHRTFRENRFFGSLDGLRALSVVGVVWFHASLQGPQDAWLRSVPVLRMGWFGVHIFFAISGFLITTLLLREQDRHGRIALRDFYVRRSLRIWPLYYAVLGVYVVLVLLTERGTARGHAFFHYLPSYLTYTYTWFGPHDGEAFAIFNFAWTLATEEQFYLLWPFAIALLPRPWPTLSMLALVGARLLAGAGLFHRVIPEGSLADRVILSVSIAICLGALLALMLHAPRGFAIARRVLGHRAAAPLALLALAICLVPVDATGRPWVWMALPLLVGACVIREDNGLAPVLRWRPVVTIGVVSYGMYLFNTLAIKATHPALRRAGVSNAAAVFIVAFGLTLLVSWLSYRYFESPFLALKQRFATERPARGAAEPPHAGAPAPEALVAAASDR